MEAIKESKTELAARIKQGMANYYGTEAYHRTIIPTVVATDGMMYLAKEAKAYWLLDLVASWFLKARTKSFPFQVWRLKLNEEGSGCQVSAWSDTPDKSEHILHQDIEYTDFPIPELEWYVTKGCVGDQPAFVIMLKSEY